jgi:hypothetical protein
VDFVRCVLTTQIILYTINKVQDCFPKALTQCQSHPMLVKKVNHRHQELTIIDLMLDPKCAQSMSMENINKVSVMHVLLVQFPQDRASSLPRHPFLWVLELLKQRLDDQVFGLLVVLTISFVYKTVLEQLKKTEKASVTNVVVANIKELVFDKLDYSFYCLGDGWVFVLIVVNHV